MSDWARRSVRGRAVILLDLVTLKVSRWLLLGVLFTAALAAGATFIILKFVGLIIDLRISAEDEHSGLDLTQHGESAYND